MKEFYVSVDVTMATHLYVDAESDEDAKRLALEKIRQDQFFYAKEADAYVDSEVVDVISF